VRPYFGDGDEFQIGFHFPVMPRIYMSLARADRTPVESILAATPPIPNNCAWCSFLRNHDELTLEMVTPEEREFMWYTYAPEPRMRLNLGIRRRLAPLLDGDRRKIELLNSILFTLPGAPIVYYGDEIGMGDNIWLDDRNGVRTPMQWDNTPNAGFSTAKPDELYNPAISGGQFGYQKVNVASQRADEQSLWHAIRRMIHSRKAHPAFRCDEYQILPLADLSILAILRNCQGESILAVHNLSIEGREVAVQLPQPQFSGSIDLFSGEQTTIRDGALQLSLPPYAYRWLQLISPAK
jgi:maltose alpha-D-glucosyltransferase/alpha-amylase